MARPGVMIYFDMANSLRGLSLEEIGMVYQGIMDYAQNGEVPRWPEKLSLVWEMIRSRIDADAARYEAVVAKRREAARRSHQNYEQMQQVQQMQQTSTPKTKTNSISSSTTTSTPETNSISSSTSTLQTTQAAAPMAPAAVMAPQAPGNEEKKEKIERIDAPNAVDTPDRGAEPRRNPSDPRVIAYVSRLLRESNGGGGYFPPVTKNKTPPWKYGKYGQQYASCWG